LANASHTKVINIDAAIAQLRTLRDTAVEERNSALLTASAHQEDLTLAKIETKAATVAIDQFHVSTDSLNFFGAGNELIRD
jgi:hypothetical protein